MADCNCAERINGRIDGEAHLEGCPHFRLASKGANYADPLKCSSCRKTPFMGAGPNGCTDCLGTGIDPSFAAGGIEQMLNDAYAEGRKDEREAWLTEPQPECDDCAGTGKYRDGLPCDECKGAGTRGVTPPLANDGAKLANSKFGCAPGKTWPFVESPGEFTRRLCNARDHFGGDMLAAVRFVLIEEPATIAGVRASAAPLTEAQREGLTVKRDVSIGGAQPPVVDRGPWVAQKWPDGRVVLQSDDFEHDVALIVNGDFGDDARRMAYAEGLAAQINAGVQPTRGGQPG